MDMTKIMTSRVSGVIYRRACLAAALAVVSCSAVAGDITGYVTSVVTRDSDGLTYAVVAGTPSSRAACAAATSYWIVAAETTESGKKQYALLLSAKTSGLRVTINGKGTCTRWIDGEDINTLQLID
jgi:hypothetical protein